MIPGHMDETGFMVKLVTKEGFVRFQPLGGWFDQVLLGLRVEVHGRKGPVPGVVGSRPPHLLTDEERKKPVDRKEMFIDVGAASAGEARGKFGVREGDPIVPFAPCAAMTRKDLLMGKAWDDRVGVALFIDLIKQLAEGRVRHPNTVYGVGTVMEEVGTRGAQTAAHLVNPDICIVLEVGIASDTPGIKPEESRGLLGKGPQVCIYDSGMIPSLELRDFVIDTAERKRIPYQLTSLAGGATDGRPIHVHCLGVPTVYLGVPTRYIHTAYGILSLRDYELTLKLLREVVLRLDAKAAGKILRK
jgi:endoglucanase